MKTFTKRYNLIINGCSNSFGCAETIAKRLCAWTGISYTEALAKGNADFSRKLARNAMMYVIALYKKQNDDLQIEIVQNGYISE